MNLIDGKAVSAQIKIEIAEEVKQIKNRINQLELLIEKMYVAKAENYKDRLVQEKHLLKEKIDRLKDFLETSAAKKLKKEDFRLLIID